MDVPYASSGASSRAHYAIVRKVENAKNAREADVALHEEVLSVRAKLGKGPLATVSSTTKLCEDED